MKKILYSLLIAGSVGGLAFGATQAFFSDRETSRGNTFQAGKVDLTIDSTADYDGMVCQFVDPDGVGPLPGGYVWVDEDGNPNNNPRTELLTTACEGTWPVGSLVSEKFWNLSDVKPGDWGENTISMHVDNNPVWACIDITNMHNDGNGLAEPEVEAQDPSDNAGEGELAQNLFFTAWMDDEDNVWEEGEPLLFSNRLGPASDILNGRTYILADSSTGTPMPGNTTSWIGLAWCAGTMNVDQNAFEITCDGAGMGNDTQTDSLTADVAFRVEQSRNNPSFRCVPLTPTPRP